MFNSVGFTGTRNGMTEQQKTAVRSLIRLEVVSGEVHHGDCIGADEDFHNICYSENIPIFIHPPINESKRAFCEDAIEVYPAKEYLERNYDIVDCSEVLIATPIGYVEELRSGTWATIRYAREQSKPVYVVFPDGSLSREVLDSSDL